MLQRAGTLFSGRAAPFRRVIQSTQFKSRNNVTGRLPRAYLTRSTVTRCKGRANGQNFHHQEAGVTCSLPRAEASEIRWKDETRSGGKSVGIDRLAFERQIQRHFGPLKPPTKVSLKASAITHTYTHIVAHVHMYIRRAHVYPSAIYVLSSTSVRDDPTYERSNENLRRKPATLSVPAIIKEIRPERGSTPVSKWRHRKCPRNGRFIEKLDADPVSFRGSILSISSERTNDEQPRAAITAPTGSIGSPFRHDTVTISSLYTVTIRIYLEF